MIDDPRDTLRLRRSLELLNGILKEFSSIKMPNGLKTMAQVNLYFDSRFNYRLIFLDGGTTARPTLWLLLDHVKQLFYGKYDPSNHWFPKSS